MKRDVTMSTDLNVSLVFGVSLDPFPWHLRSRIEGDRHAECTTVGDTDADHTTDRTDHLHRRHLGG